MWFDAVSLSLVVAFHVVLKCLRIERLAHYIDHAHGEALAKGFVVHVGSYRSDDSWSCAVAASETLRLHSMVDFGFLVGHDAICGLEAVHNRHVEVHEDQLVLLVAALFLPVGNE